jgi:hypothetical protein
VFLSVKKGLNHPFHSHKSRALHPDGLTRWATQPRWGLFKPRTKSSIQGIDIFKGQADARPHCGLRAGPAKDKDRRDLLRLCGPQDLSMKGWTLISDLPHIPKDECAASLD